MPFIIAPNVLPNKKATKLASIACCYCGRMETKEVPLTDEHVLGRRFVPKGSFASGWSLIARACEPCNNKKADLEDEISAVTLLSDLGREHEKPALAKLSAQKAAKSR